MTSHEHEEKKIRVLIVDDHQIVRQGLRTFLELQDDMLVAGEASDGRMAVDMAAETQPHVVLMDLMMPIMDGVSATREIMRTGADTRVIALSSFAEDDQVFPAIQAGASSYLLKDVSPDELVDAIRAAYRGEPRLHPDVARRLMEAMRAPQASQSQQSAGAAGTSASLDASGANELTEREREIVRSIAQGKSNQEIATELFISDKTVKTHVTHILAKLGLKDRTQLAIFAIRNNLAEPD
jgi:two-component system, NarL family, response regulator LiaR